MSRGPIVEPRDGLQLESIGDWAEATKHRILSNYIEATREVRRRFLPPRGQGRAAYIDLFAGPGRALVGSTGEIVNGSPLIAAGHSTAPFTKLVFCDRDAENAAALRARTAGDNRVTIIEGDCNVEGDRIVEEIPRYGLNLAFIDPYGLKELSFETIQKLANSSERMDLLIHYPTGAMKRNIAKVKTQAVTKARMAKALGEGVKADQPRDVTRQIDETLRKNLERLGYTGRKVRSVPVRNSKGVPMYHLVYASKHPLGDDIWESITRPRQGELPLDLV